jgi:hypothetical protein
MRSYDEVIQRCALQLFGRYMEGSYDYWRDTPVNFVAWIFDKTQKRIELDIREKFEELKEKNYKKCNFCNKD